MYIIIRIQGNSSNILTFLFHLKINLEFYSIPTYLDFLYYLRNLT